MSLKKKISIIISAAGAITAILLCVLLYRANTTSGVIELPFEKLYWGMTIEEAYGVLDEVGLDDFLQIKNTDMAQKHETWVLTAEEAGLLGFTSPGGLILSSYKQYPVHISFQGKRSGGAVRLIEASFVFDIPASEAVTSLDKLDYTRSKLSKIYGAPTNDRQNSWTKMDQPELGESQHPTVSIAYDRHVPGLSGNEVLVSYRGHKYVSRLYGGRYSSATEIQYR